MKLGSWRNLKEILTRPQDNKVSFGKLECDHLSHQAQRTQGERFKGLQQSAAREVDVDVWK